MRVSEYNNGLGNDFIGQAIPRANDNPGLCRYMASLGHDAFHLNYITQLPG